MNTLSLPLSWSPSLPLAYLVFALVCSAMLLIAFLPAWREWLWPTDVAPLWVSPDYSSEIDHFSDQFRRVVLARIGQPEASAAATDHFDILPAVQDDLDWPALRRPLISFAPVRSLRAIRCNTLLFVNGDLHASAHSRFVGVLAQGRLQLGEGCEIQAWAHADQTLQLGRGSTALRRLSSDTAVELGTDCCFERIQAPLIRFGLLPPLHERGRAPRRLIVASFHLLDGAIRQTEQLTLIRGHCKLPRDRVYVGSLVVTGRLLIGAGTEVRGNIKARGGVVVGAGARVLGSLCSEQQIQLLDHAQVRGPVVSESAILIGTQVVLGEPEAPTTVSAEHILAEAGASAHGTVWARQLGVVWAA